MAEKNELSIAAQANDQTGIKKAYASVKDLTIAENRTYVNHTTDALGYAPIDLYNDSEVFARFQLYAKACRIHNMRLTPPGLASWFGVSLEELKDWMTEPGSPEHRRIATRIYSALASSWADYALTGKTPASVAIFVAKNWFAMSDVNRVAEAPQVQKQLDLERLAAEAAALPDSDIIDADYT